LNQQDNNNDLYFLPKNNNTVSHLNTINWREHAMGNPHNWMPELRFAVSYILSSVQPVLLLWGDDNIVFYNDTFTEYVNDTLELGKSIKTTGSLYRTISASLEELYITGKGISQTEIFISQDKKGILNDAWWSLNYVPVINADGLVSGVSVTFHDISINFKTVKSLKQENTNMRLMALQAPVAVCVFGNQDYIIDLVNPLMQEMLGRDSDQLLGKPFFEAMPELTDSGLKEILNDVWASGKSFISKEQLFKLPRKNGFETVYVTYIYEPMKDHDENVHGIMVVAIDVTEQVIARLKSEQNESSIRSIIKSAPFPIGVYVGPEMIIEFANQALLDIWGKDKTVIGQEYVQIMPELAKQDILNQLTQVFTTGIPFEVKNKFVEIQKEAELQSYYLNYSFTPLYNNGGNIYGIMSTAADVTDLNLSKKRIEESQARFYSLIEEAPVATCLFTGPEMIIEVANAEMLNLWGKGNSAIGKRLMEAIPELKGQPFIKILEEVFATGVAYSDTGARGELNVDGRLQTFYFDFTFKPLRKENGEVFGIMEMAVDVTQKVLASQRILESQKQLLDSFEQSPVGIATIENDGLTFTMANAFYCELVGRNPADILHKPLLEALPELTGQGFDDILREVISTGAPYLAKEVGVELLRNGKLETIYVDLAYQPRFEQDRSVNGILVVATDVTQQVRSRRNVEASEEKLRSVIANAPAGMGLFVGRDLVIELPNQTFVDIVGKGWDIVGKPLREAMPELVTEGQPFLKILDDVFTTGKMFQSDGSQVLIVQDGVMSYNYYNITYTPLFNENREVYAILDIAIDVTEAVTARQKAEEAGRALLGAIELAELAAWSYNIKEKTFTYSPRFMEWLGITEETKTAAEIYEKLPDDYPQHVEAGIEEAIKPGGNGIYKHEHPIVNHTTGVGILINAQAQLIYDLQGNPDVLSGTARDVTGERALQQQLENQVRERTEKLQYANAELAEANDNLQKSNSELGQFAYIASHDLQEPVRKISTFIKMLENTLGNSIDERSKFYIQRIENSTQRMTSLIRDILGYSQLSKDSEVFSKTNLNDIFHGVLSDFELIIEQKNVMLTIDDMPVIEAIPLQMTQLFGNLISNSIKYSREEVAPVITVSVSLATPDELNKYHLSSASDYYKINFKDNGIGFKQDYAHQIFNIFQRLHSKNEYWGTGIGLAMCKKIVQNHNGDIFAFSDEGEGAHFVVYLPVKHI
jgi:PAS domain S-box-containing protein